MIPVTYGYARVSKTDQDEKNLETQLRVLRDHGIRQDHIFTDVASGRSMQRPGWRDLMGRAQPGDTIVVAFLDRLNRSFEEGVRIQVELTERDIGIVASREGIDTSDSSAAAKLFRRMMLAQGAYQVESTSERIRLGQQRARDSGKHIGRKPRLTAEDVEECLRMLESGASLRRVARFKGCSPETVKRAVGLRNNP